MLFKLKLFNYLGFWPITQTNYDISAGVQQYWWTDYLTGAEVRQVKKHEQADDQTVQTNP